MRAFVTDAAASALSQVIAVIALIATQVVVVRTVDMASFGTYATATAICALLDMVYVARSGEVALQTIGAAWSTGRTGDVRELAREITKRDLVIALAILAVAVPAAAFTAGRELSLAFCVSMLSIGTATQVGYGVSKTAFIVTRRLQEQARFEVVFSVLQWAACTVAVIVAGIRGLIAAQVATSLFKTVWARRCTAGWLERGSARSTTQSNRIHGAGLTTLEGWAVVRNLLAALGQQADILMLAALRGGDAVALYRVARTLASIPTRCAAPVWVAVRPRLIAAWHAGDRDRLTRIVVLPAIGMLTTTVVGVLVGSAVGSRLLALVYGPEYVSALWPALVLIAGAGVFAGATGWLAIWVVASGHYALGIVPSLVLSVVVLIVGGTWSDGDPLRMALTVAGAMVCASALGWGILVRAIARIDDATKQRGVEKYIQREFAGRVSGGG
jgi:O-antigen/teichoic acid export membrane protein